MRSFLFLPGDSPRKFARARSGNADALIIDLEDSVAFAEKAAARHATREMLGGERNAQKLFVRVNAFETGLALEDLAAVMPMRPDGVVLPKCSGAADIARLAAYLDAFEVAAGAAIGAAQIVAVATETAEAMFGLASYKGVSERLWGLMWGAEDLAASLGATTNNIDGLHTEPFRLARNLCLMAAAAAGIAAIDTVSPRIDDITLVEAEARAARRDGFSAKAAIHPNHVDAINAAFMPSQEEIAWAEKIVAAFAASPQAGAIRIDGAMIDKPHERAARKILAQVTRNRDT